MTEWMDEEGNQLGKERLERARAKAQIEKKAAELDGLVLARLQQLNSRLLNGAGMVRGYVDGPDDPVDRAESTPVSLEAALARVDLMRADSNFMAAAWGIYYSNTVYSECHAAAVWRLLWHPRHDKWAHLSVVLVPPSSLPRSIEEWTFVVEVTGSGDALLALQEPGIPRALTNGVDATDLDGALERICKRRRELFL